MLSAVTVLAGFVVTGVVSPVADPVLAQLLRGAASEYPLVASALPPPPPASSTDPASPGASEPADDLAAAPDLGSVATGVVDPAGVLASGFVRPAEGPITSRYGPRFHPVLGVWKLHTGTDIGAACGSPVRAVRDGVVRVAGAGGGYGERVVVDHAGALATTYNHLSAFTAAAGMRVLQGQVIGYVGTSGLSTGCHLHFEVLRDGAFLDSGPYLDLAPAPFVLHPPALAPTTSPAPLGPAGVPADPSALALPQAPGMPPAGLPAAAAPPAGVPAPAAPPAGVPADAPPGAAPAAPPPQSAAVASVPSAAPAPPAARTPPAAPPPAAPPPAAPPAAGKPPSPANAAQPPSGTSPAPDPPGAPPSSPGATPSPPTSPPTPTATENATSAAPTPVPTTSSATRKGASGAKSG